MDTKSGPTVQTPSAYPRKSLWIRIGALSVAFLVGGSIGWVVRGGGPEVSPSLPPVISIDPPTYVALGDSFSAGEGVQPYAAQSGDIKDGGDNCHRSTGGHPTLLLFDPAVHVDFRACSGAVVANVYDLPQRTSPYDQPAVYNLYGVQASGGVLNPNVGLVTLTMGGNDVKFSDILKFCAIKRDCMTAEFKNSSLTLGEWADVELPKLEASLDDLYKRIRNDAPNAIVVVLGYAPLFPEDAPSGSVLCWASGAFAITKNERSSLRELEARLNETIRRVAEAEGVEFLDTASIFEGHEPCGPDVDWMNFVRMGTLKHLPENVLHRGPFHPNPQGQRVLAYILSCYLHDRGASSSSGSTPSAATVKSARPSLQELDSCVAGLMAGRATAFGTSATDM